ncbi:MAG: hypothetical protein EXR71_15515 [Myxococcales bacterium]|nr:hypothetical protein [Myxococcales bacterium]
MRVSLVFLLSTGCGSDWLADTEDASDGLPPELYLVSPKDGLRLLSVETVTVQAVVIDDRDEPATLEVRVMSSTAGVVATGHPDKLGQFHLQVSLPEGTHDLWIEAEDSDHRQVRRNAQVVVEPTRVTAPVVTIEPQDAVTGVELTAVILTDAWFADDSPFDYRRQWSRNGAVTEFTDATVPGEQVVAGDIWEAWVIAVTGGAEIEPGKAFLAIGNAPPVVGVATIEADALAATLHCGHDAPTDPEGDPLTATYAWRLDGDRLDDTTPSIPTPLAPRGSELACRVTVSDGNHDDFAESALWDLPNHAPTLAAAIVTPEGLGVGTTAACALVEPPTDLDGDEVDVSYSWFVDGAEVGRGPTLPAGTASRGAMLHCVATGDDGHDATTSIASAPFAIANTPPTPPKLRVSPDDPTAGETLTCTVVDRAYDLDGDAVTCQTRWEVALTVGEGETFSTVGLAAGSTVRCLVACSDGLETGVAGVISLSLGDAISGETAPADAMVLLSGTAPGAHFGSLLSRLGDLDGDGAVDLGVGAPDGDEGAVYLYTSASLRGAESLTADDAAGAWRAATPGDGFGAAGAADVLGDLDGDGDEDLALAAARSGRGGADAGQVYVVYGGAGLPSDSPIEAAAAWSFVGEPGDGFGARLTGGDLDGDGLAELIAAGPTSSLGGAAAGAVAVFAGDHTRPTGTLDLADSDAIVVGAAGSELGWGLALCPDADGDGAPELALGASRASPDGREGAGVFGLLNAAALESFSDLDESAWFRVSGDAAGDQLGAAVACPGDLDEDGLGDVFVGVPRSEGEGTDSGSVAVFFGRSEPDVGLFAADADARFLGAGADARLGAVLATAGDLDHDGVGDVLAGAPGGAGGVEVYRALSVADWTPDGSEPDASIAGNSLTERIGQALAGGLDLEGDGFAEVAVGAPTSNSGAGAVYVFSGR